MYKSRYRISIDTSLWLEKDAASTISVIKDTINETWAGNAKQYDGVGKYIHYNTFTRISWIFLIWAASQGETKRPA